MNIDDLDWDNFDDFDYIFLDEEKDIDELNDDCDSGSFDFSDDCGEEEDDEEDEDYHFLDKEEVDISDELNDDCDDCDDFGDEEEDEDYHFLDNPISEIEEEKILKTINVKTIEKFLRKLKLENIKKSEH